MLQLLPEWPVCWLSPRYNLSCTYAPVSGTKPRAGDWKTSRKMGTYYLATLLFKTYFRVCPLRMTNSWLYATDASLIDPAQLDSAVSEYHSWDSRGRTSSDWAIPSSSSNKLRILYGLVCILEGGLQGSGSKVSGVFARNSQESESKHLVRMISLLFLYLVLISTLSTAWYSIILSLCYCFAAYSPLRNYFDSPLLMTHFTPLFCKLSNRGMCEVTTDNWKRWRRGWWSEVAGWWLSEREKCVFEFCWNERTLSLLSTLPFGADWLISIFHV